MSGSRWHPADPELVARVLGRAVERVQVWAVDRVTGEPFFLHEGRADEVRPFARERLRCPYPGCDAVISTKGKSKRDHFFHANGTPHATGGESENHLAAKALIAVWARRAAPAGSHVLEEESVKDLANRVNRRADVMVTVVPEQLKVAFEVEYKAFAVEDWALKDADYKSKDISCAWLIGHTRLAAERWHFGPEKNAVRLPTLARGWVPGGHVLIIDPVERVIGTLAADAAFTQPVRNPDATAFVTFESLDDCRFDPTVGILTPAMVRIDAYEEQRRLAAEAAARAAAAKAEDERQRLQALEDAWANSPLKVAIEQRWEELPKLLTDDIPKDTAGFKALPIHWRTVIYEAHIHPWETGGSTFTVADCVATLRAHGIVVSDDRNAVHEAVMGWMGRLSRFGLVAIRRSANAYDDKVEVRCNLIEAARRSEAEAAAKAQQEAQRKAAEKSRIEAELARRQSAPPAWTAPPQRQPRTGTGAEFCRACGLKLDPILHRSGYHVGCGPSRYEQPRTAPSLPPQPDQPGLFEL